MTRNTFSIYSFLLAALCCVLLPSLVRADNGSVAIYRESGGAESITTSNFNNTWDTIVREDSAVYTLNGGAGGNSIDLKAGHYIVLYSARWDSTGGSNRSSVLSRLNLAGSDLPIGWSQGFLRRSSGADETFTTAGGILEVATDGDDLILQSFLGDSNSATVARAGSTAGIMLLKIDDDWDYLRLGKNTTQAAPTNTTWVDVTFNVQDELDTSSFAHTSGSAAITLKTAGHYLIFANTFYGRSAASNDRNMFQQRLTLDGSELEGSRTTVYIRGNQNGEAIYEGATAVGTLIETSSANQILNVEVNKEDGTATYTINQDKTASTVERTGITIVKLPDDGEYIRLEDSGTDNINPTSLTDLGWDTELEEDTAAFTHPSTTAGGVDSAIEVEIAGDYLFLSCNHADASGTTRSFFSQGWRVNDGSTYSYGLTGNYNRNSGANDAGNCSGILLNSLSANDYVETVNIALAATGTDANDFKGLQGFRIASAFVEVSGTSDLSDATEVSCAVNGTLQSETSSVSAGVWALSIGRPVSSGDVVSCWANGVADAQEALAVAKYDGSGDMSGLVLNAHELTLGSDDNQSFTLSDLGQYDNDDDEDVMHTANGSTLSVDAGSVYADENLHILSGNTLSLGTAETLDTHHFENEGTLTLSGSTTVTVSGDWDNGASAVFTAGTSTVTFDSTTADQIITSSGDLFYNLTLNATGSAGSDDVVLVGALDVDNDLTFTDGDLDPNTNGVNITLGGDWVMGINGSLDAGSGLETVVLDGTNQTISGSSSFNNLTKVEVSDDSTDSVLTIEASSTQTIAGTLNLAGKDGDDRINLVSDSPSTFYTFDVTAGTQNLSWLDVTDAHASSNDILATFSVNSGGTDSGDTPPTDQWIFASTFFWVGSAGGNTNDAASWASSSGACGTGGSGIPGSSDVAVFDSGCTNNATVDATLNVGGLDIRTGYSGTITTNADLDVDGLFSMVSGTLDLSVNDNNLNVSGNISKTGGTFTAGTGVTTLDGFLTLSVNGGTAKYMRIFTHCM